MNRRCFTLIELLVVVGIIVLLVAILLPTLSAARRFAKSTVCLSQMRQLGLATMRYVEENRDLLPRSTHSALAHKVMPWGYAITPYLAGHLITGPGAAWEAIFNGIYRCPDDRRRDVYGYGKNVWFELTSQETGEVMEIDNGPTYPRISNVPRPGATILYGELASGSMADHIMAHFWYFGGKPEVDEKRHGRTSNYVFVDGHGEARQFRSTFDPNAAKDPGTRNDPNTWVDLWDPAKAN